MKEYYNDELKTVDVEAESQIAVKIHRNGAMSHDTFTRNDDLREMLKLLQAPVKAVYVSSVLHDPATGGGLCLIFLKDGTIMDAAPTHLTVIENDALRPLGTILRNVKV